MGFLKNLFGGGSEKNSGDSGIYLYVILDISGEIVKIRLDPAHELNVDYEQGLGYFSKKYIVGPKSYRRAEATFHFNDDKSFLGADIDGGELSSAEAYDQQLAGEGSTTQE